MCLLQVGPAGASGGCAVKPAGEGGRRDGGTARNPLVRAMANRAARVTPLNAKVKPSNSLITYMIRHHFRYEVTRIERGLK